MSQWIFINFFKDNENKNNENKKMKEFRQFLGPKIIDHIEINIIDTIDTNKKMVKRGSDGFYHTEFDV